MSDNCCQEYPKFKDRQPDNREKNLIRELVAGLNYPHMPIDEIVYGQKFLAVKADSQIGLSSTLGATPSEQDLKTIKGLPGQSLLEVSEFLFSKSPFMISIGLAALNAGTEINEPETGIGAAELIVEKGTGQEVVVVGDFPFIDDLRSVVGQLYVLELNDISHGLPTEQWQRVLNTCQVAAITSTALLTRYMTYFLHHTENAYTILLGPSTPMSTTFYRWGASALAGSRVRKVMEVLEGIKQDMSFRQLKRLGIDFVLSRRDN